jgi:hypothetical protein
MEGLSGGRDSAFRAAKRFRYRYDDAAGHGFPRNSFARFRAAEHVKVRRVHA